VIRTVCVLFAALASAQEPVAKFGTTVVINSGFRGDIYSLHSDTKWLPDFRKMKPKGSIYTTSLNAPPQSFKKGFPGVTKRFEWFAIVYTGRIWIANPGAYRFVLTSDDGSKLWIDDRPAIDNDGIHWAIDPPTP
jgi:PA14 domain